MLLFVHPAEGEREEQFRFMDFVGEGGEGTRKIVTEGGTVGDFRGKLLEVLVKDFGI
jgi:hypothetical protein